MCEMMLSIFFQVKCKIRIVTTLLLRIMYASHCDLMQFCAVKLDGNGKQKQELSFPTNPV